MFNDWKCNDCNLESFVCENCIQAIINKIKLLDNDNTSVIAFLAVCLDSKSARQYARILLETGENPEYCDCSCHKFTVGVIRHMVACCNGQCKHCLKGISGNIYKHEEQCRPFSNPSA